MTHLLEATGTFPPVSVLQLAVTTRFSATALAALAGPAGCFRQSGGRPPARPPILPVRAGGLAGGCLFPPDLLRHVCWLAVRMRMLFASHARRLRSQWLERTTSAAYSGVQSCHGLFMVCMCVLTAYAVCVCTLSARAWTGSQSTFYTSGDLTCPSSPPASHRLQAAVASATAAVHPPGCFLHE